MNSGSGLTSLTWEDGLAANDVRALLRDRHGNLWCATGSGVIRFDGERFETFSAADGLAGDGATSLLEDGAGVLWAGMERDGGWISRFDGAWTSCRAAADGATGGIAAIAEEGEGQLYWAAGECVYRRDGDAFERYTVGDGEARVLDLAPDGEGVLWVGTDRGLYRLDESRCAPIPELAGVSTTSIVADDEGQLWCGTEFDGVRRFDGQRWVRLTTEDGLVNDQICSALVDGQGNIWFGGIVGVSRFEKGWLTHVTQRHGLPYNLVMSICEDHAGHLWIGSDGVHRYDGQTFTELDELRDRHGWYSIIQDVRGHLWFGSMRGRGAVRHDGTRLTSFTTEDGLASNDIYRIYADRQSRVWFSYADARKGVTWYDGEHFETFTATDGLDLAAAAVESPAAISFLEDRQGMLWLGSRDGLFRFDGECFTAVPAAGGPVLEDRHGHLWLRRWNAGVVRYDGHGTQNFTTADGLADNQVFDMLEDERGHLWFATYGGGVSRYDGLVFQSLSREDGLTSDQCQEIVQARDGAFWIATERGLTRYRPSPIPPAIRLAAVTADQHYEPDGEISIAEGQRLVGFDFEGMSQTTPAERMAFVCRLEGRDRDWRPVYTGRAEYLDLPVGDYTFRVRAVDRDLNYSEEATVTLSVVPDPRVVGLTDALRHTGPDGEFVGRSRALRQMQSHLRQVAPTEVSVLIQGETGTGKGLAARALHDLSPRADGPFISVNCGGIPEALVESELFGHERGAFTGAVERKLGKVELARGGSLFLDEIGDMPLEAQVKLLKVLEEATFERVGGTQTLTADVRIISATNRDLKERVDGGQFRADLYFRLEGFPVQLPPLRERGDDIPLLALHFMERMAAHLGKEVTQIDPEALEQMRVYGWPGNVRELEHAIQRAVIVCASSVICSADLRLTTDSSTALPVGDLTLEEYEARYLRDVLEQAGWVIKGPGGAAVRLGLSAGALRRRMEKHGLKRS